MRDVAAMLGARRTGPWSGRRSWWAPWIAPALAVVLVAALVAGHGGSRSAPRGSPTAHPAVTGLPSLGDATAVEADDQQLDDVGDPYVLPVPAGVVGAAPGYILYWTTDWASNVPTATSTDLVHWHRVADSLPVLPTWARVVRPPPWWPSSPAGVSTDTWGPTVRQVGDHWVLYYATEDAATGHECIGAATATDPLGPYVDHSRAPLVCQATLGGDIDPSIVAGPGGHLSVVFKDDGNSSGAPVSIWEQPLTPDGISTAGPAVRLLGADQAWEHGIIEGPSMLADTHGGWWLFYSGGTWQSDTYDTGVAWCATVAGPCRQPSTRPWLASTPTATSPGGLDTFTTHAGKLWASYSAFPSPPGNAQAAMASPRVLELAPVLSH